MRRLRHYEEEAKFSLFPFLDALSGVIGILALVIAAMAAMGLSQAKQVIEHPHSETDRSPVYVECQQDKLIIHPEKLSLATSEMNIRNNPWQQLLSRIRSSRDLYLVLLIRPTGYDTYYSAILQARQFGIDIGYDAITGEGQIEVK